MRDSRPYGEIRRIALACAWSLAILAVLAAALAACAPGRDGGTARKAPPTALEALRIALPELRRAHPDGEVESIYAVSGTGQELTAVWGISVWIPSETRVRMYHVRDSEVRASSSSSGGAPPSSPPLVSLNAGALPTLVDSDRALAIADAAGAGEFSRKTGAVLLSIDLDARSGGRPVWEISYGKKLTYFAAFAYVDATTGEVIRYAEQNAPRTTATPRG